MRLLVLGGTAWLGGTVAAEAARRGHDVVALARGESGSVPETVTHIRADRTRADAYAPVAAEEWDVVLDVSRQPGQVRSAVASLEPAARHCIVVSSGNAYADHSTPGADESAALLPPLAADVMESMETYGEAKVACEAAVLEGFGAERSTIVRAGLIGGPGDWSGRTGYWPRRFALPSTPSGAVLVPEIPDAATQVIDVRDLAAWLVDVGERRVAGVFNATGPTLRFADHLASAREVAGHTGEVVSVDPAWLLERGVQEWMGPRSLPLWIADPGWAGFSARTSARAVEAGLRTRPLNETLADVLTWELGQPAGRERGAGLSDPDERDLLDAWAARSG